MTNRWAKCVFTSITPTVCYAFTGTVYSEPPPTHKAQAVRGGTKWGSAGCEIGETRTI